jgi:hypothetical protein
MPGLNELHSWAGCPSTAIALGKEVGNDQILGVAMIGIFLVSYCLSTIVSFAEGMTGVVSDEPMT